MNEMKIKIIGKNENQLLKKRLSRLLKNLNVKIGTSDSLVDFVNDINLSKYSILLLTNDGISLDSNRLFMLLEQIALKAPKIQILLLVSEENVAVGIKALKAGTYQYIKIPVSDNELKLIIETAIDQQPQIIEQELVTSNRKTKYGEIIGGSSSMLQVYSQIEQAAQTDIPVLILGETGTGKDLVSYTIHKTSGRKDSPYLAVNLAALPSELVASELFGHEKGAFTGSHKLHKGVFEQGSDGTVFLDEIDTMDEKVQVSLLRLLEQKTFKRLGGTKTLNSKARLIAATNENLDQLVDSGIFRIDLFYRLDVFRIVLPPLRERKDDIPLIIDEMLLKYSKTYKKNIISISKSSLDALMNFDWPGNVRELKNVIQRAVLVCSGKTLTTNHLPKRFLSKTEKVPSISIQMNSTLFEVERQMISHALAISNNNKATAAKLLGISRRAIYNKLKKHNL